MEWLHRPVGSFIQEETVTVLLKKGLIFYEECTFLGGNMIYLIIDGKGSKLPCTSRKIVYTERELLCADAHSRYQNGVFYK